MSIRAAAAHAFLCLIALPIASLGQQSKSTPKLPDSVRLGVRARAGDETRFRVEYAMTATTVVTVRNPNTGEQAELAFDRNDRLEFGISTTVKSVDAQGRMVVATHESTKQSIVNHDGARKTHTFPERSLTVLMVPEGLSAAFEGAGAHKRKRVAGEAAHLVFFPDNELHVGDTWNGETTFVDLDSGDRTNASFVAHLAGIEMHRGVPCAKIEVSLDLAALAKHQMSLAIQHEMHGMAQLDGEPKTDGVTTIYCSLDRGTTIDEVSSLVINAEIDASVRVPNHGTIPIQVRFASEMKGHQVCTQFPKYDPGLVPAHETVTMR